VQALRSRRHTVVEAEIVRHLAHSAKEGDSSAAAEDKSAEAVGRIVLAMDSMFAAVDSTVGAVQKFAAVGKSTDLDTTEVDAQRSALVVPDIVVLGEYTVEAEQKAVAVESIGAVDMGTAVEAAVAVELVQLYSIQVDIEVAAHWDTGTNAEDWDSCTDTSAICQ